MKAIKWFWILASLGLWLTFGIITSFYLIKYRALSSIEELSRIDSPSSILQISSALTNIKTWFQFSQLQQGKALSYSPEWLTTTIATLETILVSGTLPTKNLSFACTECSSSMKSQLEIVTELANKGRIKELAYERILELQEKFISDKKDQIKLHFLLAKDFADLMGSAALYQSKGESELLYYEDGPFKWLPKLDDSARPRKEAGSYAVEGLSQKIESLKSQSKVIVETYQNTTNKLGKIPQAIATLERERTEIRLKMKKLMLDGLKEEVSAEYSPSH